MNKQTALEILEAFEPGHLVKEATAFLFNDQYEAIKVAEEALKNEEYLEDRIADLENDLDDAYEEARDEIADLKREIKDLNEIIGEKDDEIARLEDLIDDLKRITEV